MLFPLCTISAKERGPLPTMRPFRQRIRRPHSQRAASPTSGFTTLGTADAKRDPTPLDDVVWFHSLELGDGLLTDGVKSAAELVGERDRICLPADLGGNRVLDIG